MARFAYRLFYNRTWAARQSCNEKEIDLNVTRPLLVLALTSVVACSQPESEVEEVVEVPEPDQRRFPDTDIQMVVDNYHGRDVSDPYRWLEALGSEPVEAWVKAQNEYSRPRLDALPARVEIQAVVEKALERPVWSTPVRRSEHYFYRYNDGTWDQPKLYRTEDLSVQGEVVIDPETLSDDGTVALSQVEPSPDGRFLAYSVSDGGSDWRIWRVQDLETGEHLPERIDDTKFTSVSWMPGGEGFFYSRYPRNESGVPDDQRQIEVFYHALGEDPVSDELVFSVTDHPRRNPYAEVTSDGRHLVVNLFDGYEANGVLLIDLKSEERVAKTVFGAWDAEYTYLGDVGDQLFFHTNKDAPRGRIVAVEKAATAEAFTVVVPESDQTIESADLAAGMIVINGLSDAHSTLSAFAIDGTPIALPELPGLGTVRPVSGGFDDESLFFSFEDFGRSAAVYRWGQEAESYSAVFGVDESDPEVDLVSEQVFIASNDGEVRIPAFIVRRRGVRPNGDLPVLLYGYGGFNIPITPTYSGLFKAWLDMGGVFVSANLRGGGEYGAQWHKAGTRENKQNVFDDFISVAEWLTGNGYTRPGRLAIMGRSNGGLLVGAVMTQRPDLFGAALPAVGVLDMLRYHTASANAYQWSSDYGASDDPEAFSYLFEYSPVHNTTPGECYPKALVTTADRDDRVVPWHSYKFAAVLQRDQGCDNEILLRVETRAGHGAGKPRWMIAEDYTDQLAFTAWALGFEPELAQESPPVASVE